MGNAPKYGSIFFSLIPNTHPMKILINSRKLFKRWMKEYINKLLKDLLYFYYKVNLEKSF